MEVPAGNGADSGWPELRVRDRAGTRDTLHLWTQIVGKIRTAHAPKHEPTVRYALDGSFQPIAVTSYTYETLPAEERAALPSPPAISAALEPGTGGDADNQD